MGNMIRTARKQKHMTMKELGRMTGLAESTISGYETGKRQPDNTTLVQIADILGVTVDYLLGRDNLTEAGKEKAPSEDGAAADDRRLDVFNQLSPENQEKAKSYLAFLLASQENG